MIKIPYKLLLILITFTTKSSTHVKNLTNEENNWITFDSEATLNNPTAFAREHKDAEIAPLDSNDSKKLHNFTKNESSSKEDRNSFGETLPDANLTSEYYKGSQFTLEVANGTNDGTKKTKRGGFKISSPEEDPYSVLVVAVSKVDLGHCTGSLLSYQWVLTASNCLTSKKTQSYDSLTVYAGGNSISELHGKKRPLGSQLQHAKRQNVFTHPSYKSGDFFYDVALVKVDQPFLPSKSVKSMPLSLQAWKYRGYERCTVAGFGLVQMMESKPSDGERKKNTLEVISPCPCFEEKDLKQFMICSKPRQENVDCTSDCSGAALICQNEIRGVDSLGFTFKDVSSCSWKGPTRLGCGKETVMTAFAPTCAYLGWINSHVHLFKDKDIPQECKVDTRPRMAQIKLRHKQKSSSTPTCADFWLLVVSSALAFSLFF